MQLRRIDVYVSHALRSGQELEAIGRRIRNAGLNAPLAEDKPANRAVYISFSPLQEDRVQEVVAEINAIHDGVFAESIPV